MTAHQTAPWYVGKRAEAFVYSLFADRHVTVRNRDQQDIGVDFVLDLRKGRRELGHFLAVQVLAYVDFPSEAELRKEVARQFPLKTREEFPLPLVVFAIQVKELAAVYAWVIEPIIAEGEASLCSPFKDEWKKLDDEILARVHVFWDTLLKKAKI